MLGGFGVMSVRVPCKSESEIERPVFRRICGSVSRAKMTPKIIPTSTPVDPIGSGIGSGRIDRALVAVCAVPVPAPFPDVAVHVVQPPGIGSETSCGHGTIAVLSAGKSVIRIGSVVIGLRDGSVLPRGKRRCCSGPTGVLPFCFRREPVAVRAAVPRHGSGEEGNLLVYVDALQGEFKLGIMTLIPAIVIIVLLLCKVNAIVSLGLSAVCAGAVSWFCQGATLQSIIRVAYNGYSTQIEEAILKTILNRGGMSSMLQYVAIICFAVGMGGMLDRLGVLENILNAITATEA